MKTVIALFALLTAVISVQAQEYDDMYFKSKDRVKVTSDKVATVRASQNADDADQVQARINPTDSYSGRNVNPEYTSRNTVTSTATDEDAQYFVSGYVPTGVNQSLTPYNSGSFYSPYYGNGYASSAFNNSYYGYGGYSSFYSPYSSFYSPYGFGNGFYSGMSLGMGYMWGGMGSGYYGSMGYGNMWGSPYYNSYYGGLGYPYYGYGSYYGYPSQVVVINNNNGDGRSGYVYGKRGSRSSDINNQSYNASTVDRGRSRGAINNTTSTGGRSASTSQYYQSGWRSNPDVQRNITNGSNSGRSSWGSSSWGNSGTRQSSGWDSNSGGRSSWGGNNNSGGFNSGSSSFGRSSGGSFGGGGRASHSSGGGGGSRGRH